MKSKAGEYTIRYALIQAAYWINFVTVIGYAGVYLLGCGLSNSQLGAVMAAGGIAAAMIQPIVGSYADRPDAINLKIITGLFPCVALPAALLLCALRGNHPFLIAVLFGICIAALQAQMPFINSLGSEMFSRGVALNWGISRAGGSAAYAVCSYIIGFITARAGITCLPLSIVVTFTLLLLSILIYPFPKKEAAAASGEDIQAAVQEAAVPAETGAAPRPSSPTAFVLRYPRFIVLILGSVFLYAAHNMLSNFLFQIVQYKGGGSEEMGVAMALCAIVELPTLFAFSFLLKKAGSSFWLRVSAVFLALKSACTLIIPSIAGLYAVQFLQMAAWALLAVTPVYYVKDVIAREDAIKGQAYIMIACPVGSVLASLLGGWLLDIGGAPLLMAVSTASGFVGMVIVLLFSERTKPQA